MQIVFGPILSRRFGVSLGIDLSPNVKQCNFNCVYCELAAAKPLDSQSQVISPEVILESIRATLKKNSDIDVLTFTANGEPTLYPHLENLIIESKKILKNYPHIKTLILSNGSRLKECKDALKHFDIVKFSLDSIDSKKFKKVDKPSKKINLDSIKEGIVEFANEYKGDLVCEILIVENMNDDIESNALLADFLRSIKVARIDLSTIDRPSSHRVNAINQERLYEISKIYQNLNVCIAARSDKSHKVTKQEYKKSDILELLKMRPLSKMDCEILFSKSSLSALESLLKANEIRRKNIIGVEFYCL